MKERLYELVPMLMINFKYAIVTEELKHMLYALQDPALAHDEENIVPLRIRHYVYVRQPPTGFAGATGCGKPDRLPLNR